MTFLDVFREVSGELAKASVIGLSPEGLAAIEMEMKMLYGPSTTCELTQEQVDIVRESIMEEFFGAQFKSDAELEQELELMRRRAGLNN